MQLPQRSCLQGPASLEPVLLVAPHPAHLLLLLRLLLLLLIMTTTVIVVALLMKMGLLLTILTMDLILLPAHPVGRRLPGWTWSWSWPEIRRAYPPHLSLV